QSGTLIKKDKLSARLEEGFVITQDYLSDKNIMGMSNTSIRKDVLYPLDIPDRLVAVDWFVFFQYLKGNTAVFTKKTWTYYRQHGANTLGDGMVSQESILRKIDAMIFHMEALKTTDGAPHEKLRDLYLLKERVSIDKEMLYLAQKDLSKAEIDYFWFEDISSLL
ncbi:MAG TPA: hypothetical protein VL947_02165, partial [Cytophagales bacterium]|nr:hypothetical protein [Cytophagales bacterium]